MAAQADDLAVLEMEASRRGTSLARVLREVVAERARELRADHRPHFGVARSRGGAARAAGADEDAPLRSRQDS